MFVDVLLDEALLVYDAWILLAFGTIEEELVAQGTYQISWTRRALGELRRRLRGVSKW